MGRAHPYSTVCRTHRIKVGIQCRCMGPHIEKLVDCPDPDRCRERLEVKAAVRAKSISDLVERVRNGSLLLWWHNGEVKSDEYFNKEAALEAVAKRYLVVGEACRIYPGLPLPE